MKLHFKNQAFQRAAAEAVCAVFSGQSSSSLAAYTIDPGIVGGRSLLPDAEGWRNGRVVLSDAQVLSNIQAIQRANHLPVSSKLEGRYNLTIEMETGVGKTYTYVKTMYELSKRYQWRKFIIVVPSVAIREGVRKSFETLQEHFAEEYGEKVRYSVYNSSRLSDLDRFASEQKLSALIVNAQAFNARGKDARRIRRALDEFQSRRPIDAIAATRPILIIDEPQSVEGTRTKEALQEFCPLFTLRYSATHKRDSLYNMVYRLDALDAYNRRLVKKIEVKGIVETGATGTTGYVYFAGVNLSAKAPTATLEFDAKGRNGLVKRRANVDQGYDLFARSNGLAEYADGYVVTFIDGRDDTIEFQNGVKMRAGDVIGKIDESTYRRVQIRETILSHIERERRLFRRGIKVLSLFFIDEVAKYRVYDSGAPQNGVYADMFEQEYADVVSNLQREFGDDEYIAYLNAIPVAKTHAGYFSVDKKRGSLVDGKTNREGVSDDADAYDLIMRNKEKLLDLDPEASPVRFIFSHSALREGWDNPNVFQICTLKQSSSAVRKRQEVGRGLRLCVDQNGERMDEERLGDEVHEINALTIVASESYDSFAKGLQSEIAEAVGYRPLKVTAALFEGKELTDFEGVTIRVDKELASEIVAQLTFDRYVDAQGRLTDAYFEAKNAGGIRVAESVARYASDVIKILDSVYDERLIKIGNASSHNVVVRCDQDKLASAEFRELWARISPKTYYLAKFDDAELIRDAVAKLNRFLFVSRPSYVVKSGVLDRIESREKLEQGEEFQATNEKQIERATIGGDGGVKYDLIGRIAEGTGLTRRTTAAILKQMNDDKFDLFKINPEEFFIKTIDLINETKATAIVREIEYDLTRNDDKRFSSSIFTEPLLKGKLDVDAKATPKKHLYDHLLFDSQVEVTFADALERAEEVSVYVKLPRGFYIPTPVGNYNPDWAIAFRDGDVKRIYFVAETKGTSESLELREIESAKIRCARKHFEALDPAKVRYEVVDSYEKLRQIVTAPCASSNS